ncbi:amidohydrolase family protein [Phenylobacterium sp.]|uniref:amidohydrolase family protein n=1 Tax=Phenylobacterium sp. TaxID=1871053 RepID=UPI003002A5B9
MRSRTLSIGGASVALAAFVLTCPAASQPNEAVILYRGATLIDGKGGPPRPGMAILVQGERIVAVAPAADVAAPPGAEVVEADGLYVLPGLIDSHVHLATAPERKRAEATLRRQIYSGVTAVRDMAGDGRALADLARSARLGLIPAPDIHYASLMAGPSFFDDPRPQATAQGAKAGEAPWMQAVTVATNLPRAVARAEGTSASGIKIYTDLPLGLIAPIVAESHRQGMKVWSHAAIFPTRPGDVIRAGVDVISHACLLDYEFAAAMPGRYASSPSAGFNSPEARFKPMFDEMRRRGTILDATLFAYGQGGFETEGSPNKVLTCKLDRAAEITKWAFRAGVAISAGTDGETTAGAPFPALNDELEHLARAGLPPLEVLRAASLNGARAIGQEAQMGVIEPGKLADLVFVREDPTKDVRALRSITLTVKRGVRYQRSDFLIQP